MKIAAIALNTFREGVRQPAFYILTGAGAVLLLGSIYFTLFSFGEEAKMVKDMGLATITLLGLVIALFTSSSVVADEIDKKTALTVLCKPVSRPQFVVGKFLGVVLTAAAAMAAMAVALIVALWLHGRVAIEHVHDVSSGLRHAPGVLVGVLFGFMQVFSLAAVSVAVSTRLPMMANMTICLSLYVLGHVSRHLFAHTVRGGLAGYLATVTYALAPNLSNFDVAAAIGMGHAPPVSYVLLSALYALTYAGIALLAALASFETRELM